MTVPTVERGFFEVVFCSMEIAGDRPSIEFDVRLVHLLEELARVGRERLDVAALALGVERVEGERGLARAGEPGDHHELVARDVEVDVLEVVLAGTADRDPSSRIVLSNPIQGRSLPCLRGPGNRSFYAFEAHP